MTRKALFLAVAATVLSAPAAAHAATTIGGLPSGSTSGCSPGRVWVQAATGHGPHYEVPAGGGVITSWQTKDLQSSPDAGVTLKTLVPEPGGADPPAYRVRSSDVPRKTQAGTVTYPNAASPTPVRMPVAAGERLGFYLSPGYVYQCYYAPGVGDEIRWGPSPDAAAGELFTTSGATPGRLNVAAVVEPDVDKDGFGDESQDSGPGSAGPAGGCPLPPPPDITKPSVLSLRFATPTFRAAARGAAVARAPVGSRVRYGLSESATIRFTIERRTAGYRSGAGAWRPRAGTAGRADARGTCG